MLHRGGARMAAGAQPKITPEFSAQNHR